MNTIKNIILGIGLSANLLASERIIGETNSKILASLQDKSKEGNKVNSSLGIKLYDTEGKFNKDVKNTIVLVASEIDKIKPEWLNRRVNQNGQFWVGAHFKF